MKTIFSLFAFPVLARQAEPAEDEIMGQNVFEYVVDAAIPEHPELNQSVKSVYVPGFHAVRALRQKDCPLLKESLRSLNVIVQESFIKPAFGMFREVIPQDYVKMYEMLEGMYMDHFFKKLDDFLDEIIHHQSCPQLIGHDEF